MLIFIFAVSLAVSLARALAFALALALVLAHLVVEHQNGGTKRTATFIALFYILFLV